MQRVGCAVEASPASSPRQPFRLRAAPASAAPRPAATSAPRRSGATLARPHRRRAAPPSPAAAALSLAAAALLLRPDLACGQLYTFEKEPVPLNRTLHTLYAFYVFSYEDAPEKKEQPFFKFSGLQAQPSGGAALTDEMQSYEGFQLSMMRYRDFWRLINPQKFCSTDDDVTKGLAKAKDQLLVQKDPTKELKDVDVYSHTVKFSNSPQKDIREYIDKTGVYILIFSNCGAMTDATVSGSVIMKNAYGFLPGNEYYKMPFYGWLLVVYLALAAIWLGLSLRWWKEIFMVQNCIAAVILFGLIESFLWFIYFNDWNGSGNRGKILFTLAIFFTVIKATFSYMLVLVAALGWGVTRPYLDSSITQKIQILSFVYIVLDFIREAVLSFRHSHSLSISFVLLCLLPVSLLNGVIFSWIFTALSNLMETLKERRQAEKLLLFQRLWKILIFAIVVATFTLLFQIFNLSRSITARWKFQWFISDAISHGLFLFVLMAMMYLWAPHKYSQRFAYSQVKDDMEAKGGEDHPGAIWADDDGMDDEDDGESFWATTKGSSALSSTDVGGAKGETIGALS